MQCGAYLSGAWHISAPAYFTFSSYLKYFLSLCLQHQHFYFSSRLYHYNHQDLLKKSNYNILLKITFLKIIPCLFLRISIIHYWLSKKTQYFDNVASDITRYLCTYLLIIFPAIVSSTAFMSGKFGAQGRLAKSVAYGLHT